MVIRRTVGKRLGKAVGLFSDSIVFFVAQFWLSVSFGWGCWVGGLCRVTVARGD